jgi:hypothetical protein
VRDLFGEIPVSFREVELWLYKVPRLPHYARNRASYTKGYNVISKIQAHKARGALADAIPNEICEFCGQVLCADQADILPPVRPVDELARLQRRVAVLELVLRIAASSKEKTGLVSRFPL